MSGAVWVKCATPECKHLVQCEGMYGVKCSECKRKTKMRNKLQQRERYDRLKAERKAVHAEAGGQVWFECGERCKFFADCNHIIKVEKRDWDPFCAPVNPRYKQYVAFVREYKQRNKGGVDVQGVVSEVVQYQEAAA